jgi:hypothetical protein
MSPGAMASRPNEPHNTTTSIGLWSSNVPFLRIRVAAMQGRQREPLSFSRRVGRPRARGTAARQADTAAHEMETRRRGCVQNTSANGPGSLPAIPIP